MRLADEILDEAALQQAWEPKTAIEAMTEFIDHQDLNVEFEKFLQWFVYIENINSEDLIRVNQEKVDG